MVHLINHPLIDIKLSIMRDKNTSCKEFKECLDEISMLMSFEVFKNIDIENKEQVITPTGATVYKKSTIKPIILVPILRAGMGLVDGIKRIIPTCLIGHIGMARNEKTLQPYEYFCKVPEPKDGNVVILDPMLATGGSSIKAISSLIEKGYKNITLMCLVGCPEGVKKIEETYPNINLYLAAIDEKLNEKGYIIPGLGDAGDRIFGTLNKS